MRLVALEIGGYSFHLPPGIKSVCRDHVFCSMLERSWMITHSLWKFQYQEVHVLEATCKSPIFITYQILIYPNRYFGVCFVLFLSQTVPFIYKFWFLFFVFFSPALPRYNCRLTVRDYLEDALRFLPHCRLHRYFTA